jgi:hypothetical protein
MLYGVAQATPFSLPRQREGWRLASYLLRDTFSVVSNVALAGSDAAWQHHLGASRAQ